MTEPMPYAGNSHLTSDSDRAFFTHSHLTKYPLHPSEEQNPKEEEPNESELHQVAEVDSRDIHLSFLTY